MRRLNITRLAAVTTTLVGVLAAGTASAALMSATYEGQVSGGVDVNGFFGAQGELLTGKRMIANFIYETNDGYEALGSPIQTYLHGGNTDPKGHEPLKSVTITIGGVPLTLDLADFGGTHVTTVSYLHDLTPPFLYKGAVDHLVDINKQYGLGAGFTTDEVFPFGLTDEFTVHPKALSSADIIFRQPDEGDKFGYANIYGYAFSMTVERLDGAGAVPEPAAWALMILGFGAAGSALRRRGTLRRAAA